MPGLDAETLASDDNEENVSGYDNLSFGFQLNNQYNHAKRFTNIVDITYNPRMSKFVILDTRGVTSWLHEGDNLSRDLTYPKYQTRLLRSIIFCEKHHVYFAICSDFTLQVFNKEFHPTCKTENPNMRSILHMVYNAKSDELITAGIGGTIIWTYRQTTQNKFDQIKSMANYRLTESSRHQDVGGSWCTKIVLMPDLQQVFFCSENDLYVYALNGLKPLFTITNAHSASLTCAGCCRTTRMLITGSMDSEVKVWGSGGGHISTFRGHSQSVTSLVVYSRPSALVLTSSLDGTVKVWSLNVMELLCSINVFPSGIDWMDVTQDGKLWCATDKEIYIYKFNSVGEFWGHARCKITSLHHVRDVGKSHRVVAVGEDGSVRMFNPNGKNSVAICTALPPPVVSLTSTVLSVGYGRHNNLIFMLIEPEKIWVYTGKTDPACRVAEWNISGLFNLNNEKQDIGGGSSSSMRSRTLLVRTTMHKPMERLVGFGTNYSCCCLAAFHSRAGFLYSGEFGICSAKSRDLLLLGLQDGRIIFLDQVVRGKKYFEVAVSKDPVRDIKQDTDGDRIYTNSGVKILVIQIWKLPEFCLLMKLDGLEDLSAHSLFRNMLVTGQSDGSLIVTYVPEENDQPPNDEFVSKNLKDSVADPHYVQMSHKAAVIDIQPCVPQSVFASCSSDGAVKIWNFDKILLTEICLDNTLSSCCFLGPRGDLLIGWMNHVYVIDQRNVSSHLSNNHVEVEASECAASDVVVKLPNPSIQTWQVRVADSVIYEDPAMRYDHSHGQEEKDITLENYLVPYSFILKENPEWENAPQEYVKEIDVEQESTLSEKSIHAPSTLYGSPAESIHSFMDFDANNRLIDYNNWLFPHFGTSPGPTPSSSVESVVEFVEKEEEREKTKEIEEKEEPSSEVAPQEICLQEPPAKDSSLQLTTLLTVTRAISKMKHPLPEPVSVTLLDETPETPEHSKSVQTDVNLHPRPAPRKIFQRAAAAMVTASKWQKNVTMNKKKEVEHLPKPSVVKVTRPKKVRKNSTEIRLRAQQRRSSISSLKISDNDLQSDSTMSSSPNEMIEESNTRLKAKTLTFRSTGIEVPLGRNVSIPSKFPKQKFQPPPIHRPFKDERSKGAGLPKSRLKSRTGGKKRSTPTKTSNNHFHQKVSLSEFIPSNEPKDHPHTTAHSSTVLGQQKDHPHTTAHSSTVLGQQKEQHFISIPKSQSLSHNIPRAHSFVSSRTTSRESLTKEPDENKPVTEVHLVHKQAEPFKSEYWKPEQSVCDNHSESAEVFPDDSSEKPVSAEKVLKQNQPSPLFNIRRSLDSTKDRIAKRAKDIETTTRPVSTMGEISPHDWLEKKKRPVTHCGERSLQSDDGYDDDMKVPSLVDYRQFQPIYKNDGLQFDESWQDRMLDRYLQLKKQREERHASCCQKRAELEQDRKYKILANKPELTYGDMYAWYQDHARLADYILNSPLLSGNRDRNDFDTTPRRPLATPLVAFPRKDSQPPAGRPPSAIDPSLDSRGKQLSNTETDSSQIDPPKSYRFSLRHDDRGDGRTPRRLSTKSAVKNSPRTSRTRVKHNGSSMLHRPFSSRSHQLLLLQRPRSSASIPGKTRYILVKDEDSFSQKLHPPTPSKMEEDLLRKRFPVQHQSVVKAMKKLRINDSEADISEFDDWDIDDFNYPSDEDVPEDNPKSLQHQKSVTEPSSRSSTSFPLHRTSSSNSRTKITHNKTNHTTEISSSTAKPTPFGYSPISVLHRKTSCYMPTSFKV